MSNDPIQVESWKSLPGFPDYFISDFGNVRSFKRRKRNARDKAWREIKTSLNSPNGYPIFTARDGDNKKQFLVHRAVLECFVGPCPSGHEACHQDGTKNNNRLDNLRWGTRSSNALDQVRHGVNNFARTRGDDKESSKLRAKDILKIRKLIERGKSTREIAKLFGVSQPNIIAIKGGRTWSHVK